VRQVALGDVCDIVAGGTPSRSRSEYFNGAIPWVKIGDMLQGRITTTEEAVSAEGLANSSAKLLPRGTVLISIFATIGRTAVLDIDAATNQAIAGVLPKPGAQVDRAYLRHCLDSTAAALLAQASGVAQININSSKLRAQPIPLPPLREQRRIAEVLDRAETLRAQRRQALAQLDALAESIFLDMFGEPTANPKKWARVTLNELIESGPQNGLYKPSSDYGSGTPILRIDAFYDGAVTKLDSLKRVRLSEAERQTFGLAANDIVINRVNSPEYLGKSALIPPLPEPIVFESNMMRFRLKTDRVHPGYLVHFLQSGFIKSQIRTGSKDAVNQSSINQQDVKGFQVNVPPLDQQESFVHRIAKLEVLRAQQLRSMTELDALFASLQHRAFRGEL
jgi:type I restriction enzyme, S subunit